MFLGVDIGTQSLKAVVCDEGLSVHGQGAVGYQPSFPRPGWAEQDPSLWIEALGPAIAAALAQAERSPADIRAMAVGGQLDGCIPVGTNGQALGPALIWMDRRAAGEIANIDPQTVLKRAGVVLDASHMAAKIRWLQRHGPKAAVRYHQPVSYLTARLTDESRMDHALASTSMVYGLSRRDYDDVLLDAFDISEDLLPAVAEASDLAGTLSTEGAALTGLPEGLPVAVGTGDDFSNALGAGLAKPGQVICALGTAEVVGALDHRPVIDPAALVETHAYPGGLHFIENPGWLSGGALTWFLETHRLENAQALDAVAAQVPPGSDGLVFVPALSGAMAPEWVAEARGCYYGLTPAHGVGHMARAVLEGCAFAMRDVVERLDDLDVSVESLLLVGGGANSGLWAQIRADVTGLPVEIPRYLDTSPIGAAVLAGVAIGQWPDISTASSLVGEVTHRKESRPDRKAAYDAAHGRYRELFDCLRPLFREPR